MTSNSAHHSPKTVDLQNAAMVIFEKNMSCLIMLLDKGKVTRIAIKKDKTKPPKELYDKLYHHEDGCDSLISANQILESFFDAQQIRVVCSGVEDLYWRQDRVTVEQKNFTYIKNKEHAFGYGNININLIWEKQNSSSESFARANISIFIGDSNINTSEK